MKTLHYSIVINAPRNHVYNLMLGKDSYTKWTAAFSPGSYFEGSWDEGEEIRFIDPNHNCILLGHIKKNTPNEYVSIRHVAMDDGSGKMEPTPGPEALENYIFNDVDGGTEVKVEMIMELEDQYVEMMDDMWPKALQDLKTLAENNG